VAQPWRYGAGAAMTDNGRPDSIPAKGVGESKNNLDPKKRRK